MKPLCQKDKPILYLYNMLQTICSFLLTNWFIQALKIQFYYYFILNFFFIFGSELKKINQWLILARFPHLHDFLPDISHLSIPLAPDPIRVQSCVCFLFRTNRDCMAVTSIFLSISLSN